MLSYNEIGVRKFIVLEGEPYEVVDSHIFRMQQRKPQNKTKLKNLISGRVVEMTFHQSDKAEEAEIEYKEIQYLYSNRGEHWFCEKSDQGARFTLPTDLVGEKVLFLKQNSIVEVTLFNEKIIGVHLPAKVDLKVTEAAPAVKGDTAQGAQKQVTVETGATLNVPLFVKEGDILRINTETGQYVERM